MEFNIEDQLINGIQFNTIEWTFTPEVLISDAFINVGAYGIRYYNGVLIIEDNNIGLLQSSSPSGLEAYVDENKILKLR
jgi:hypothetical protein